jgi:hypothetical protein
MTGAWSCLLHELTNNAAQTMAQKATILMTVSFALVLIFGRSD